VEKITREKQNENLMTYFGKRVPEDGRINWDWQRERIYNWVRALAPPYPGAFCFLKNIKIHITQILFSDFGFFCNVNNGTIVAVARDSFVVKTSNGCIEVVGYNVVNNIIISNGDILT
jgi:methionyl-tRNA formyltransferase